MVLIKSYLCWEIRQKKLANDVQIVKSSSLLIFYKFLPEVLIDLSSSCEN